MWYVSTCILVIICSKNMSIIRVLLITFLLFCIVHMLTKFAFYVPLLCFCFPAA